MNWKVFVAQLTIYPLKKIKKIISPFFRILKRIHFRFTKIYRTIFLLYGPNLQRIINGKIVNIKNLTAPQQKVLLTGRGIVKFEGICNLGYKLGGFNKGGSVEIQPRYLNSCITFGNNVSTNNNIFICAANQIAIGDNTRIGQNVTIMDFEAHGINPIKRSEVGEIGEVKIGENVWIGNNVIILKNSIIGENSIVAAGAVLSGNFPNNVIIGGVPAKIIKHIDV